jgi:hypothetical protein
LGVILTLCDLKEYLLQSLNIRRLLHLSNAGRRQLVLSGRGGGGREKKREREREREGEREEMNITGTRATLIYKCMKPSTPVH